MKQLRKENVGSMTSFSRLKLFFFPKMSNTNSRAQMGTREASWQSSFITQTSPISMKAGQSPWKQRIQKLRSNSSLLLMRHFTGVFFFLGKKCLNWAKRMGGRYLKKHTQLLSELMIDLLRIPWAEHSSSDDCLFPPTQSLSLFGLRHDSPQGVSTRELFYLHGQSVLLTFLRNSGFQLKKPR